MRIHFRKCLTLCELIIIFNLFDSVKCSVSRLVLTNFNKVITILIIKVDIQFVIFNIIFVLHFLF